MRHENIKGRRSVFFLILLSITLCSTSPRAGTYLKSAHGNSTIGVNRTSAGFPTDYATGNCAHCHEQHSSIQGAEPVPTGGPNNFLLFDENYTSQTINFCFDCHQANGYQTGGITINKSYSYNFGGNTNSSSYDSNIKDAFSHIGTTGSSHYLPSFVSQVLGKTMYDADGVAWSLPANINPCDACHNPHLAQRNKNTTYDPTKSAISRPSDHNNLWGDNTTERMSADFSDYQAPYWYGSNTSYEPANDATTTGSNLPNYVRLCTDCHNEYNTIYSENPRLPGGPRNIRKICWKTTYVSVVPDAHGAYAGSSAYPRDPYNPPYSPHTLCCTDCHEPHGSATNIYLIRSSINGVSISVPDTTDTSWRNFCLNACHTRPEHDPYKPGCSNCHYHGGGRGGF